MTTKFLHVFVLLSIVLTSAAVALMWADESTHQQGPWGLGLLAAEFTIVAVMLVGVERKRAVKEAGPADNPVDAA